MEYRKLFSITIAFEVIGTISIILAVIGLLTGLFKITDSYDDADIIVGTILVISSIILGLLLPVIFFLIAELIKVIVKIEFNTRRDKYDDFPERSNSIGQKQRVITSDENSKFKDWKKDNPTKSLNDYYAFVNNKIK